MINKLKKGRMREMIIYRVEENWGSGGCGYIYETPREVYEALVDDYGHDEAANIEGWCELASVGEEYNGDGITVYVYEE